MLQFIHYRNHTQYKEKEEGNRLPLRLRIFLP